MFGSSRSGANAYAKVGIETGAMAASPHKLIVMLFDAALLALSMAQLHMKAGDIEKKGLAISRAIMLIDSGLRASLDKKAGGTIAENLDALYGYMNQRLLMANLKNQPELVVEVHALLKDLKTAWDAIAPAAPVALAPQASPSRAVNMPSYDALAPRAASFVYG